MELWIRNQDRDILTKVESFCCVNNTIVCLPTRLDCSTDLGTYKTPERALEILEEIQGAIIFAGLPIHEMQGAFNSRHLNMKNKFTVNYETKVALYLMPKE